MSFPVRFGDVLPIERYGTQTPPWLGSLGAGGVSYAVLAIGDYRIMLEREREMKERFEPHNFTLQVIFGPILV